MFDARYISGRSGWMVHLRYPWVDTVPHFRKIGTPHGRFARFGIHAGIAFAAPWWRSTYIAEASLLPCGGTHLFLLRVAVHWLVAAQLGTAAGWFVVTSGMWQLLPYCTNLCLEVQG